MARCVDYLILGSGAAGHYAAETIREQDSRGSILILTEESTPTYKRPMLSKSPLIRFKKDRLSVCGEAWYREQRIETLYHCRILSLDAGKKCVETDVGEFHYQKCLYALGGYNFVPPFPGHELCGVLTVRRTEDLRMIKEYALGENNAVVIGGGVIGLEIALEMQRYGLQVTVLEASPRLMPRQLDPQTSEELLDCLKGIRVCTNVSIAEICGSEGRARSVQLADGRSFPCGLVAVSCGQKANIAVAQAAGLPCGRAVIVNERMETGIKDIWACGDCAELNGFNAALWTQAAAQGRVAGANAAGGGETLGEFDRSLVLNGGEMSLFALGDLASDPQKQYECRRTERTFQNFSINTKPPHAIEKRFYCNGRITGGCILGNLSGMEKMKREITEGAKL